MGLTRPNLLALLFCWPIITIPSLQRECHQRGGPLASWSVRECALTILRLRWRDSFRNPEVLCKAGTYATSSILLTAAGDVEAMLGFRLPSMWLPIVQGSSHGWSENQRINRPKLEELQSGGRAVSTGVPLTSPASCLPPLSPPTTFPASWICRLVKVPLRHVPRQLLLETVSHTVTLLPCLRTIKLIQF